MRRGLKLFLVGGTAGITLFLALVGFLLAKAIPIGTGYAAKYMCSSVFISRRDPDVVFSDDIAPTQPLFRIVRARVDEIQKAAYADSFGFFESKAIYREGCGCTLLVGTTEEELRNQRFMNIAADEATLVTRPDSPWPKGSRGALEALPEGVDGEKLKLALNAAFSEPEPGKKRRDTRAVSWSRTAI